MIEILTYVSCDNPGCDQWTLGAKGNKALRLTARHVAATKWGWYISRKRNFCPDCAKAKGLLK